MKTTLAVMFSGSVRTAVLATAAAALVACSAGRDGATPPMAQAIGANSRHHARGKLTLRVRMPKKRHHRVRVVRHGKPAYISAATQGMSVAITGPTNVQATFSLQPTASGCSSSLTGTFCTLTLGDLQPCAARGNCYTATIATYDAVSCTGSACTIPPSANELSAAQDVAFAIVPGVNNTIAMTLEGIPASLSVYPLHAGYLQSVAGNGLELWGPAAQHVVVEPLDADGDVIVGPGAPSLTLTSGSSAVSIGAPPYSSPNVFTVQAASPLTPGTIALSVTAMPTGSEASPLTISVPLTIAHSILYVSISSGGVEVFDDGSTSPSTTITTGGINTGIAVDTNGTLYGANSGANTVTQCASSGSCSTLIGSGLNAPSGVAVDTDGTVYVADSATSGTNKDALMTCTPTGACSVLVSTGLNAPSGVAVDANGTVYVANNATSGTNKNAVGACGSTGSCTFPITGLHQPQGVAVDSSGNVYIANFAANTDAISKCTPSGSCTTPITGLSGPVGVAVDANGTIYITNSGNGTLTECSSAASCTTAITFPAGTTPEFVAVVPRVVAP